MVDYKLVSGDTASAIKRDTKPGPYYIKFGLPGKRWSQTHRITVNGMDSISIFKSLSPRAAKLWWSLVQVNNPRTNIAILRSKDLTPSERNALTPARKELIAKDLIRILKREHYLLQPAIAAPEENDEPSESNFLDIKQIWDSLP